MTDPIPDIVIQDAADLICLYGNQLSYLGEYNDCQIYRFLFPKDKELGFPVLYLYDKESNLVLEVTNTRALQIIEQFIKP